MKNSLKTSSVYGALSSVIEGIFETFRRALVEYDDGRVLEMVFGVTHGNGPRDYKRAMLSSDRDDWVEILSKKMGSGFVSWSSKKQTTIALCSAKAEDIDF